MHKKLVCKYCGEPRDKGRRMCKECYRYYKRIYSRERYLLEGRYIYGTGNCETCGKSIKLYRLDQSKCKDCAKLAPTNPSGVGYRNPYTNAGGQGYCWLHRRIAENLLKRKLKSNEIVHHLDENPSNNSLQNLVVLSRSSHARLHHYLRVQRALIEESISETPENCWEALRVPMTTTWLETAGVKVIKLWEIG